MDYERLSRESLDTIMDEIRKANGNEAFIPEKSVVPASIQRDASLEEVHSLLESAGIGTSLGLRKAEMKVQKGLRRLLARFIEKIYLRVSELTNRDVRTMSSSLITALDRICGKLEQLFYNDQLLEKQLTELSGVQKKERRAAERQRRNITELEALAAEQQQKIAVLSESLAELTQQYAQQSEKLEALERSIASSSPKTILGDIFYHDFEEHFRGSQTDVYHRLEGYLPLLQEKLGTLRDKVLLDLGCGRGELLDVLRTNGANDITGVDMNQIQLQVCREKGHKVIDADCISYLSSLPSSSVDGIFAIQLIEHLGVDNLDGFFAQCGRVLKKGGLLLLETPNCENLLTATRFFDLDPSHDKPVHPELARFLAQRNGFAYVEIHGLHPVEYASFIQTPALEGENAEICRQNAEILNQLFYGPQDYALVGIRS